MNTIGPKTIHTRPPIPGLIAVQDHRVEDSMPQRHWFVVLAFLVFFALIIVLPNSIRISKMVLLPCLAAFSLYKLRKPDAELLIVWGLMSLVSIFYLMFPPQPRVTPVIFVEIGFVYVAAPLGWLLVCEYVAKTFSFAEIQGFLFWCVLASFGTVLLFYYLFLNYGSSAVTIFMKEGHANVAMDQTRGEFKATMHVFGSIIFLGAAFIAAETLRLPRKILIVLVVIAIAFISGRSALIMGIGIGTGVFVACRFLEVAKQKITFTAIAVVLLMISLAFTEFGQSLIDRTLKEISQGGGAERTRQFENLLGGIRENWGMGSGHTAHVSYIRDVQRPWRYEMLPLSLVYRVGVIGVLVYFYPVYSSFWRIFQLIRAGQANQIDVFFATGMTTTAIATLTNPYMESFEFQWCLLFPYCYFRFRPVLL